MSDETNTPDASCSIKVVDGIIYQTAQADIVKTVEDLVNKNTSNPLVKFILGLVGAMKGQLDWSGIDKDLNI